MNVVVRTPALLVLRDSRAGTHVVAVLLAAMGVLLLASVLGIAIPSELRGFWPHVLVLVAAVGCLAGAAAVLAIPASEVRIDRPAASLEIRRGRECYRAAFGDIEAIRVDSRRDADGDMVYRVTLATTHWRQPLSLHWRPDLLGAEAVAGEIRAFVAG